MRRSTASRPSSAPRRSSRATRSSPLSSRLDVHQECIAGALRLDHDTTRGRTRHLYNDRVGRRLDTRRKPSFGQAADPDGNSPVLRERFDGGCQTLVGEHRRKMPCASSRSSAIASRNSASASSRRAAIAESTRVSSCERASRSESESPTSRCWAPSWRSRSSCFRSASPASTMRARDARSSSSRLVPRPVVARSRARDERQLSPHPRVARRRGGRACA